MTGRVEGEMIVHQLQVSISIEVGSTFKDGKRISSYSISLFLLLSSFFFRLYLLPNQILVPTYLLGWIFSCSFTFMIFSFSTFSFCFPWELHQQMITKKMTKKIIGWFSTIRSQPTIDQTFHLLQLIFYLKLK